MSDLYASDVERIVVGVVDAGAAEAPLRWALREAVLRGARVVALAAWEVPAAQFNLNRPPAYDQLRAEVARETHERVIRSIARARALEAGTDDVRVDAEIRKGSAADMLCEASDGAALIVVGARSQRAWQRALLGSTSTDVLRHARCPVVVLRAGREDSASVDAAEVKALVDAL